MNPDHGSFKSWVPQSVDWRKNLLSSETILKNLDWLPYVGPYLTRNIVKNVFPRLSHKDQTMFLTACDTKSVESTIEILSIVMQDPKLRHKKWINSAVQGILSLDDGHAFHETQDMLFHLLHHNLAPREIILEIVNRLPARTLPLFIYSNKDKLGEGVSYGSLFDYGFAYKIPELSQKWHEYIDSDPEYLKIFPTTDIQNYAGISSYEDIAINDAKITPEIILTLSKLSELNRLSIYSTGDLKSLREMFGLDESNLKILFESFTKKFERLEVSIFNKTYTSTSDIGNSEIHEKEQLVFRFFDLFYKYAKYLKIDVKMTDPTQGACPELKDRAQTFKNALIELAKKYGHASPIFQ